MWGWWWWLKRTLHFRSSWCIWSTQRSWRQTRYWTRPPKHRTLRRTNCSLILSSFFGSGSAMYGLVFAFMIFLFKFDIDCLNTQSHTNTKYLFFIAWLAQSSYYADWRMKVLSLVIVCIKFQCFLWWQTDLNSDAIYCEMFPTEGSGWN